MPRLLLQNLHLRAASALLGLAILHGNKDVQSLNTGASFASLVGSVQAASNLNNIDTCMDPKTYQTNSDPIAADLSSKAIEQVNKIGHSNSGIEQYQIQAIGNPFAPLPIGPESKDGKCGPRNGDAHCKSGCCSIHGWCGGSEAWCSCNSCVEGFGSCGSEWQKVAPGEHFCSQPKIPTIATANALLSANGDITRC